MATTFRAGYDVPSGNTSAVNRFCPECGRPFAEAPGERVGQSAPRSPWPEILVAVGTCLAGVFGVRAWGAGGAAGWGPANPVVAVGLLAVLVGSSALARRKVAGALTRRQRWTAVLVGVWTFGEHGLAWGLLLLIALYAHVLLAQLAAGAALSGALLDETTWRTLQTILALMQLVWSGDPTLSAGTHN